MLTDTARELLADIMTANRSLSGIPSASAVLDPSNYTFQAISYGKDANGFKFHAHEILSPSADGKIKVVSYENLTVSSYHSSATAVALDSIYKMFPASPLPTDTRLEKASTVPNYSLGVVDAGQCLNAFARSTNDNIKTNAHLIGCFPASGGTDFWVVSSASNPAGSIIYSGTLSSTYNEQQILDSSGFLTFAPGVASDHSDLYSDFNNNKFVNAFSKGVIRPANTAQFPKQVDLIWYLPSGDAGSLLLFGGIYHFGLWCLDLKQLLKEGKYPPYSFDALNNQRKYKLFAKHTFNKDLLYLNDYLTYSGFLLQFTKNTNLSTAWGGLSFGAIIFNWSIKFA